MCCTGGQGDKFTTRRGDGDTNTGRVKHLVIVWIDGDPRNGPRLGVDTLDQTRRCIERTGVLEDFGIFVAVSVAQTSWSVGVSTKMIPFS